MANTHLKFVEGKSKVILFYRHSSCDCWKSFL